MSKPAAVVTPSPGTRVLRRPRLDSLTGLRAIAALVVFGRHVDPFFGNDGGTLRALHGLTVQGSAGVSLFFILSGFVLTWSADSSHRRRDFWRRRGARIVPAYLAGLLLALVTASMIDEAFEISGPDLFSVTLLQSWIPNPDWFFAGNPVGWSLSTEVFFYLIAPFVIGPMIRASRRAQWALLCSCTAFAILIPCTLRPNAEGLAQFRLLEFWFIYVSPPVRALEFVAGISLAALIRSGTRVPVNLGTASVIAAAAYVVAGQVPIWAGYVAVTMAPFLLLVAAAADSDIRGRRGVLRGQALVTAGVWSYSFYLVHLPVVRLAEHHLIHSGQSTARTAIIVAGCLVGAGLLSWLLFACVERPAERLLQPRPARPAPCAGVLDRVAKRQSEPTIR